MFFSSYCLCSSHFVGAMRLVVSVVILVLSNICDGSVSVLGGDGHGLLNNMAIDKNLGKVRVSNEQHVACFCVVQFVIEIPFNQGSDKNEVSKVFICVENNINNID